MKTLITRQLKGNKMHEAIDQLLMDGKEEDAIPLIEEVWKQEAQAEKEMVENLRRRLEMLGKRMGTKESSL